MANSPSIRPSFGKFSSRGPATPARHQQLRPWQPAPPLTDTPIDTTTTNVPENNQEPNTNFTDNSSNNMNGRTGAIALPLEPVDESSNTQYHNTSSTRNLEENVVPGPSFPVDNYTQGTTTETNNSTLSELLPQRSNAQRNIDVPGRHIGGTPQGTVRVGNINFNENLVGAVANIALDKVNSILSTFSRTGTTPPNNNNNTNEAGQLYDTSTATQQELPPIRQPMEQQTEKLDEQQPSGNQTGQSNDTPPSPLELGMDSDSQRLVGITQSQGLATDPNSEEIASTSRPEVPVERQVVEESNTMPQAQKSNSSQASEVDSSTPQDQQALEVDSSTPQTQQASEVDSSTPQTQESNSPQALKVNSSTPQAQESNSPQASEEPILTPRLQGTTSGQVADQHHPMPQAQEAHSQQALSEDTATLQRVQSDPVRTLSENTAPSQEDPRPLEEALERDTSTDQVHGLIDGQNPNVENPTSSEQGTIFGQASGQDTETYQGQASTFDPATEQLTEQPTNLNADTSTGLLQTELASQTHNPRNPTGTPTDLLNNPDGEVEISAFVLPSLTAHLHFKGHKLEVGPQIGFSLGENGSLKPNIFFGLRFNIEVAANKMCHEARNGFGFHTILALRAKKNHIGAGLEFERGRTNKEVYKELRIAFKPGLDNGSAEFITAFNSPREMPHFGIRHTNELGVEALKLFSIPFQVNVAKGVQFKPLRGFDTKTFNYKNPIRPLHHDATEIERNIFFQDIKRLSHEMFKANEKSDQILKNQSHAFSFSEESHDRLGVAISNLWQDNIDNTKKITTVVGTVGDKINDSVKTGSAAASECCELTQNKLDGMTNTLDNNLNIFDMFFNLLKGGLITEIILSAVHSTISIIIYTGVTTLGVACYTFVRYNLVKQTKNTQNSPNSRAVFYVLAIGLRGFAVITSGLVVLNVIFNIIFNKHLFSIVPILKGTPLAENGSFFSEETFKKLRTDAILSPGLAFFSVTCTMSLAYSLAPVIQGAFKNTIAATARERGVALIGYFIALQLTRGFHDHMLRNQENTDVMARDAAGTFFAKINPIRAWNAVGAVFTKINPFG